MAKNIIVLGAGASHECGAPLMGNFLDVAQELYARGLVSHYTPRGSASADMRQASFKNVFEAIADLQAVHSKSQFDIKNLESIFTALEMAKTLRKFPNREPEDIDQLIEDLKRVIIITLECTVRYPNASRSTIDCPAHYGNFINGLFNIAPSASVAFLTFNYDTILDLAFYKRNIQTDYALNGSDGKGVPLLKLHGSLNWAQELDGKKIVPWSLKDYFEVFPEGASAIDKGMVPIGSQIAQFRSHTSDKKQLMDVPVIVPPSWNKADSHRAIAPVWNRAAKELEEADSIFVVGYSLPETDSFFRLLYALGATGRVPLKRFWVYNPDENRKKVFYDMLGPGAQDRFAFKPIFAPEAFTHIQHTIRSTLG